jgi:hypothetical protein
VSGEARGIVWCKVGRVAGEADRLGRLAGLA